MCNGDKGKKIQMEEIKGQTENNKAPESTTNVIIVFANTNL